MLEDLDITNLIPEYTHYLSASNLIPTHNINSSDAVLLALYLGHAAGPEPAALPAVLIATDERSLRAAAAEGLQTLNPETVAPADIAARLT